MEFEVFHEQLPRSWTANSELDGLSGTQPMRDRALKARGIRNPTPQWSQT